MNSPNIGQSTTEQSSGQLTCFELFLILFPVAFGVVVGYYIGNKYGWIFGIISGVLACGCGAVIGIGLFRLFVFLFGWWNVPFPLCRVCKSKNYEWLETTEQGTFYMCRHCGTKYRLDKDDSRFVEISSEGSVLPYVKGGRFRGWIPDETSPDRTSDQF